MHADASPAAPARAAHFEIAADAALLGPGYAASGPVRVAVEGGRIAAIAPAPGAAPTGRLLIPALADAHNHARPLPPTSFGGGARPLETWLPRLALMPSVDPYLAAAAAFTRTLEGGATAAMVHVVRPMGLAPIAEEARAIARAAHDVGISIGLAIGMRDRNPLVYGHSGGEGPAALAALPPDQRALAEATWLGPLAPIEAQLAAVDEAAAAVEGMPGHCDVQYGPNGVQWCSDALLGAVAEASARTGRRVHMHLLETKPQRDWADAAYPGPGGMVARLGALGLLSDRLTLAHCVWAREDELAAIAASGARIAVNVSSNLHLYSGIAPVPAMLAAGVPVAMGLDGCALDEDDDGLRELRLFHLLNHGRGFDDAGLSPETALKAACATGRAGLGLPPGGEISVGAPADLLALDLPALDRDGLVAVDPRDLLMARATRTLIREAWSGGRQVIAGGRATGVDGGALHADLRAAYRAALPAKAPLYDIWPAVEACLADHYKGCC
ncbi:amidohydrolase family protein [Rhodovulum sp. DZ06]|uniref:amidohydrolase family protein n=1 Tax=Rhodovulum sp. DZ06 TaxID=3425126 RepID=UPI003D3522FC